jgi:hypothetical protein
VKQVTQIDAKRLYWKVEVAGKEEEWVAKIIEQTPDKRIAWTSRGGTLNGAMVTFHPLSDAKSKILLRVGHTIEGVVNNVGGGLAAVSTRVRGDLDRFKAFIETRGRKAGHEHPYVTTMLAQAALPLTPRREGVMSERKTIRCAGRNDIGNTACDIGWQATDRGESLTGRCEGGRMKNDE